MQTASDHSDQFKWKNENTYEQKDTSSMKHGAK